MRKFKVLGLLSMPLLAIAIAVVAFGWSSGSEKASASTAGTLFSISTVGGCDTATTDEKCAITAGSTFQVAVNLDALGAAPDYSGFDIFITYSGVSSKDNADMSSWPTCPNCFPATLYGAGTARFGAASGISQPNSTYTGTIATLDFNCTGTGGSINLVHGATDTALDGTYFDKAAGTDGMETLTINCVTPTFTSTPTNTFTPTNTPTNTPTSTPPPVPRWMKLQRYPFTDATSQSDSPGVPVGCDTAQDPSKDDLGNLWLTRQGTKIPPLNCQTSSDNAVFSEVLQFTPQVPDPKGVHPFAFIGGFEFEVRFDHTRICVNLVPGQAATDLGLICFVDDKDEGQPLEGIARMGCVTKGKNKEFPSEFKTGGPELAQVWIKPQPELYSINRPNQDNGVVVQLLDQNCELTDEQGHPIPVFSCEDAEVTIRFLEGDVEPDCQVDALDQQNVAFRWGAAEGSLLYNQRYDLEPSGTVKGDGDVDIKDLQFVFGRFGSSCGRTVDHDLAPVLKPLPAECIQGDPCLGPHPRQEPRNPKA
jgi:hypothetical protein